jgi:formiminotetrahydrofolate cyclodeaminase
MKLLELTCKEFMQAVDAPTPAPGGGSVSAFSVAQGISLIRMVAHLTIGKKKFKELPEDSKNEYLVSFEKLNREKNIAMELVDLDTEAFNRIMDCLQLPKNTSEEQLIREKQLNKATILATEVPHKVAELALEALKTAFPMLKYANKTAISDFGVGLLLIKAGFEGAVLNVKTNMKSFSDQTTKEEFLGSVAKLKEEADILFEQGIQEVNRFLS